MLSTRLRNYFQFALKKEEAALRENIPPNRVEKIGNILSWFAYDFRKITQKMCCDPRSLTIFFTLFFMTMTAFLFYPGHTLATLLDTLIWSIEHVHWGYLRFILWCTSECTIIGLGIRAFGRFSNSYLMKFHGFS